MKKLFFTLLLCAAASMSHGQNNPNPTVTTTPKSRELLRQQTAAGMREVIQITNAAASLYSLTNFALPGSLMPIDFKLNGNNYVPRALALTNMFGGSNITYNVGHQFRLLGPGPDPAYISIWDNHGDGSGLVIIGGGDVDLIPSGNAGFLQIGPSGAYGGGAAGFQYHDDPTVGNPLGFSFGAEWVSRYYTASGLGYVYPGIIGTPMNNAVGNPHGRLNFFSSAPRFSVGATTFSSPSLAGTQIGYWDTNALVLNRGQFIGNGAGLTNLPNAVTNYISTVEYSLTGIGSRQTNTITASITLDFSTPKLWDYSGDPAVTSIGIDTDNDEPDAGEFKRGICIIRAGYSERTITLPAWANASAWTGTLNGGEMVRLEIESYGPGEENKMLTAVTVCADPLSPLDSDAGDFISRADLTDPVEIDAIYRLVLELKSASLWTKEQAIYPFVGGDSGAHAENLRSSDYQITWSGSLSHTANGVTGDGATGYGDTGFTPSIEFASQDDGRLFAYVGSSTFANSAVAGSQDNSGDDRLMLAGAPGVTAQYSISFNTGLANAAIALASCDSLDTEMAGPVMAQRTASNNQEIYLRACAAVTDGGASSGRPDSPISLLARTSTGFGQDLFSDANLRGFSIGTKLTSGEYETYREIWERFQTRLGRNVP